MKDIDIVYCLKRGIQGSLKNEEWVVILFQNYRK